jgi:hypothetical protein
MKNKFETTPMHWLKLVLQTAPHGWSIPIRYKLNKWGNANYKVAISLILYCSFSTILRLSRFSSRNIIDLPQEKKILSAITHSASISVNGIFDVEVRTLCIRSKGQTMSSMDLVSTYLKIYPVGKEESH